ncbi:hypothetical protein BGX26_002893 [Mortierella sp. AD094]|nr:hypothetical protein BGX26_002893 [Mortierella sp. AD094]
MSRCPFEGRLRPLAQIQQTASALQQSADSSSRNDHNKNNNGKTFQQPRNFWKKSGMDAFVDWITNPKNHERLQTPSKIPGHKNPDIPKEISNYVKSLHDVQWSREVVKAKLHYARLKYNEAKRVADTLEDTMDLKEKAKIREAVLNLCPAFDRFNAVYSLIPAKEEELDENEKLHPTPPTPTSSSSRLDNERSSSISSPSSVSRNESSCIAQSNNNPSRETDNGEESSADTVSDLAVEEHPEIEDRIAQLLRVNTGEPPQKRQRKEDSHASNISSGLRDNSRREDARRDDSRREDSRKETPLTTSMLDINAREPEEKRKSSSAFRDDSRRETQLTPSMLEFQARELEEKKKDLRRRELVLEEREKEWFNRLIDSEERHQEMLDKRLEEMEKVGQQRMEATEREHQEVLETRAREMDQKAQQRLEELENEHKETLVQKDWENKQKLNDMKKLQKAILDQREQELAERESKIQESLEQRKIELERENEQELAKLAKRLQESNTKKLKDLEQKQQELLKGRLDDIEKDNQKKLAEMEAKHQEMLDRRLAALLEEKAEFKQDREDFRRERDAFYKEKDEYQKTRDQLLISNTMMKTEMEIWLARASHICK